MIRYLVDTNICIAIIKHQPETIQSRLAHLPVDEVGVSSIVVAELWYGVALSKKKKQNEMALKDFLDYVAVLNWPLDACQIYGGFRANLKKKGTPIGAMDLLIAAHALLLNAVLVTANQREFQRIPGLKIENWLI